MHPADAVIRWSNISKSYGRQLLFKQLSGHIFAAETVVVVGPNGSGKSTFLKIAAGLVAPDIGDIITVGSSSIGYCSPSLEMYEDLSGRENLEFFAECTGSAQSCVNELLTEVGLRKAATKLYGTYSSGMRQRLKLAFSLIRSPSILILDEPTIALDIDGVAIVDRLIDRHRSNGGSTLIATNDPDEVRRWAGTVLELTK